MVVRRFCDSCDTQLEAGLIIYKASIPQPPTPMMGDRREKNKEYELCESCAYQINISTLRTIKEIQLSHPS